MGRLFNHWVKKISNFFSLGKVKNQEFLSEFSQIRTFEQSDFGWVFKKFQFLPRLRFQFFLTRFFHLVIHRGGSDLATDTGVFQILQIR